MLHEPNGNPSPPSQRRPRVGLVLGGGGVLGAAWLIAALHALEETSGWQPQDADYVIGTSAGSVVGSLVAAGLPTSILVHHQRGGSMEGLEDRFGQKVDDAEEASRKLFRWKPSVPRLFLGSPALAVRAAIRPWRFPPTAVAVGWLGRGFLSTDEIGRVIRTVVPEGWAEHPNLWVVAVDYATGRRVVFGQPDSPRTDLHRAVEASCAIPGFYAPVRIGRRLYIDGGAWSPSNLDLLAREDVDIVLALNPTSSLHPGIPTTILERVERRFRAQSGRRLGREARRVRESGKQVLLVQPRADDLAAMGVNLMNPARRTLVLETALRTTAARLLEDDAQEILGQLKASDRVGEDL